MNASARPLLGKWISDTGGRSNNKSIEKTQVEFLDNGVLEHVFVEGTPHSTLLKYDTNGNTLITTQPPECGMRQANFTFTPDGKLQLEIGERVLLYRRM